MISTYQALAVALVALLPGASYTFAIERSVGSYGVKFSDRFLRFLASSAIFHALFSGPEFLVFRHYFASNELARGQGDWRILEIIFMLYVFLPIVVGSFIGFAYNCRWKIGRWIVGEEQAPRAWDFLWSEKDQGIVRMKLKSGIWLAGVYGTPNRAQRSYAAGFPTDDCDLYLSVALGVDPQTGVLVRDDESRPKTVDGTPGLLVRWAEVEYLEFQEF